MAREMGSQIPISLHLDHGDSFELCKSCIEFGFSSVMIDGSHLPYEENVKLTTQVVASAHQYDVSVEGELGRLAGIEEHVVAEKSSYTDPSKYLGPARKELIEMIKHKNATVLGSANRY